MGLGIEFFDLGIVLEGLGMSRENSGIKFVVTRETAGYRLNTA